MTSTLVIGFDSAWSGTKCGAIAGVFNYGNGLYEPLDAPQAANFDQATELIKEWKEKHQPTSTLILIDQPIIVENDLGQRDVENIVSSPVGKRYGGVQPANRGKEKLFGNDAPIWDFLREHHACLDPTKFTPSQPGTWIIETYPVLTLIALNWLLEDDHPNPRLTRQLPKYNPAKRTKRFPGDWKFVWTKTADKFESFDQKLACWLREGASYDKPNKLDQDCLDAYLCLLVGLYLTKHLDCLMVGTLKQGEAMKPGYMVVPYSKDLYKELVVRCEDTKRIPSSGWVRKLKF